MPGSAKGVGSADLLKRRTLWLDPKVVFATKDEALELTDLALTEKAGVQRQTLAAITMGTSWPDARMLSRICFVLGLELMTIEKDEA